MPQTNNSALQSPNNPSSLATPLSYTPLPASGLGTSPITFGVPALPSTATKTVVTAAPAAANLAAKQANVQNVAAVQSAPKTISLGGVPNTYAPGTQQNSPPAQQVSMLNTITGQPVITPTDPNIPGSPTYNPNGFANKTPATGTTTSQILSLLQGGNVKLTLDQAKQIAGMDFTGIQQNPDGTYTPDASATARIEANNSTPQPSTGDPQQDYVNQQRTSLDQQAQTNYDNYTAQVAQIANGTFPLTPSQQAQYNALQGQFEQLRQQQLTANKNYTGAITNLGIRAGRSRYAPDVEQGEIQGAINLGLSKIADIDTKSSAALASLQQGFEDNDYKLINAQYGALQDLMKEKNDSLASMQQSIKDQLDAQTQKIAQQKSLMDIETSTISNVVQAVMTDALNPDGSINFDTIQQAANDYGVDTNQLYSAILAQKDDYTKMQQGDQKFQTDQAQAAAQLANTQANTRKTNQDISNSAQANAASDPNNLANVDPNSQSILAQTGLSVPAFNFLTQGTGALTRMTAPQRQQVMTEAQNFLNSKGLDYSTFQSQYKAQNDVVQKSIERQANTQIFGNEVSGTTDQFIQDVGGDIPNLKPAAVLDLLVKGATNDQTAQKYAFDLKTMQNDLAGYYAASRGDSPTVGDAADAAQVIANGLSGKGAQAFKESIDANVKKVSNVVGEATTAAQKSIWTQFGVGDKYQAPSGKSTSNLPPEVESTVKSNLTFSDDNKTAYLPRSVWSSLPPAQYDAILAEAKADGVNLLIK